MSIPLLDASQLHAGPDSRSNYIQDIVQSFRDYGFVRLINHGIPAVRVAEMFSLVCHWRIRYQDAEPLAEY